MTRLIFDDVIKEIENGMKGLNVGLNHNLNSIKDIFPNIQKANMYLIGGETGTGKSAFALETFCYNPYEDYINNYIDKMHLKIFIWSMEIDKKILMTKGIARKLYYDTGILTDINYILSRGKYRISGEIYQKVIECRKYYEQFEDHVQILKSDNPTGIHQYIKSYMKSIGKEEFKNITIHDKITGDEKTIVVRDKYTPINDQTYVITIYDHVALVKTEQNFSKKEKIDKLVEYNVDDRDWYGIIPVYVQQLNRSLTTDERFRQGRVEPTLQDFKETGDTSDAANFVMALFSPSRHEMNEYRGWKINPRIGGMGDRFKSLKFLKTRDGQADIIKGLKFIGEIGSFIEIPKASDMTDEIYKEINSIKKIK